MQLYAQDGNGKTISSKYAIKKINYKCLECGGWVRLRGGPHRQAHFYHLDPPISCSQHQKGEIHLQLQSYFLQKLPLGDCELEKRFLSIQRIADVAWISRKIVFEIQCSPISAEEVAMRNSDYRREGWEVIWVLHEMRFNQFRLSAAELALSQWPHFFTNMNRAGQGIIYDQFEVRKDVWRLNRLAPLPIDLATPPKENNEDKEFLLKQLLWRANHWKLSFEGDLFSLQSDSQYIQKAMQLEKMLFNNQKNSWFTAFKRIYNVIFRYLLERSCR